MKNDRKNFPADDFDDGDKKIFSGGDFTKEKKWLIIKLLIVIIPGILYWVTSDDNFEKKVSVNVAVDAGISSKKTDSTSETLPPPAKNSQDNIALAQKKYDEGTAALNRKDYATAINFYTQAIELNPNHSYAYHDRGIAYQMTQNLNQALADMNKAIQLESNVAHMYLSRGNLHHVLKNYNAAIADFDKAIQLNPNNFKAYGGRGNSYAVLKNFNQAISDLNIALNFDPNYYEGYLFRGATYIGMANFSQAISDLNLAILHGAEMAPGNLPVAYQARGFCYQQLGDNEKAQADFGQAKILGYNGN